MLICHMNLFHAIQQNVRTLDKIYFVHHRGAQDRKTLEALDTYPLEAPDTYPQLEAIMSRACHIYESVGAPTCT